MSRSGVLKEIDIRIFDIWIFRKSETRSPVTVDGAVLVYRYTGEFLLFSYPYMELRRSSLMFRSFVYRYTRTQPTKERNVNELRHNSMYGYENNRNSPVCRYTRTAPTQPCWSESVLRHPSDGGYLGWISDYEIRARCCLRDEGPI